MSVSVQNEEDKKSNKIVIKKYKTVHPGQIWNGMQNSVSSSIILQQLNYIHCMYITYIASITSLQTLSA